MLTVYPAAVDPVWLGVVFAPESEVVSVDESAAAYQPEFVAVALGFLANESLAFDPVDVYPAVLYRALYLHLLKHHDLFLGVLHHLSSNHQTCWSRHALNYQVVVL